MKRCSWCNLNNPKYVEYHDNEWGEFKTDDKYLLEMLILESFQAGLSWECVLNKRDDFRKCYDDFDLDKICNYDDNKINELLQNKNIIRNKLKIKVSINNAKIFRNIKNEYGTFYNYLKSFTNYKVYYEIGFTHSILSDKISEDLIKRGMKFVGTTIIYSYLQAIGIIYSHEKCCFKYKNVKMRLAVIADIHGNKEALESVINDIKKRDVDKIICLGDTISLGPNSKECLDIIIDNNINMVLGNHELYSIKGPQIDDNIDEFEKEYYEYVKSSLTEKEINFLNTCPLYYECNIDYNNSLNSKKIIFSHYLIKDIKEPFPFEKTHLKSDINLWKKYNDENIIYVVGHLHNSFDENEVSGIVGDYIEDINALTNIYIVDSLGCRTNEDTSYFLIEIGKSMSFSRVKVKYDRAKFEEELKKEGYKEKEIINEIFFGIKSSKP